MQTLGQIKSLLSAHGLRPKKRFGQNFLHDQGKLEQIIAAATVQPGEVVLEVGPGTGTLSLALLEAGATLIAVEIDENLIPILREVFAPFGQRATLLVTDVLAGKHALAPQVIEAIADRPFQMVANLPYHVASPLLVNLALDHPAMHQAVVMIQREVAQRLTAGPGGKDYGPLGIIIQALCAVQRITVLPPGCFWPPPQVDSAVVRLVRRAVPLCPDPHAFATFVHRVFGQRRKQLGAVLGRDLRWPGDISPNARPEQLSIDQLVRMASLVVQP